MSLSFSLTAIRMLLGEPNPNVRSSLRTSLFRHGLRGIQDCGSAMRSHELLGEQLFDLVVLDANMEDSDVLGIVRLVREHKLCKDPFCNVILIADPPNPDMARLLVNAGADAVLIRPISVQALHERINLLIESRRPFVVTQNYIGPERRTEPRQGTTQIPEISVPSSLRNRAFGRTDDELHLKAVSSAWEIVKKQRAERLIFQIGWLAQRILPEEGKEDALHPRSQIAMHIFFVCEKLVNWADNLENEEFYTVCRKIKEKAETVHHAQASPDPQLIAALQADAGRLEELLSQPAGGTPPAGEEAS
ncbi:Putative response regulator receiver domain [Rhodospirillaceae bacterium LM-1]|nr:Putative response regulator receiver domain [Rhodospirillaceae bacterium LM-1]